MATIECEVNGHKYETLQLYFEDFTKLGYMTEEKIYPFLVCLSACITANLTDAELLNSLYKSCKDIFNKEDLQFISQLVLNKEHLLIDGKKPDNAEWEKHWQSVGFTDYRVVVIKFIKANLGNFTSLSTLFPKEWAMKTFLLINEKLSKLSKSLKGQ